MNKKNHIGTLLRKKTLVDWWHLVSYSLVNRKVTDHRHTVPSALSYTFHPTCKQTQEMATGYPQLIKQAKIAPTQWVPQKSSFTLLSYLRLFQYLGHLKVLLT